MKNFRGIWNGMVFRPDLDSSKTRAIHQKPNSPKTQFPKNPILQKPNSPKTQFPKNPILQKPNSPQTQQKPSLK